MLLQLRKTLHKITRRLQSVSVAKAFDRWAAEQQQRVDLKSRAAARMLNTCLYAAFSQWRQRSAVHAELMSKMHDVLMRLKNQRVVRLQLVLPWRAWSSASQLVPLALFSTASWLTLMLSCVWLCVPECLSQRWMRVHCVLLCASDCASTFRLQHMMDGLEPVRRRICSGPPCAASSSAVATYRSPGV